MTTVALLDDYQNVVLTMANWGSLPTEVSVTTFQDHLSDHNALVERLRKFDIICAMRERTPFPGALLERLPRLKLLVTAGLKNASIDVTAAKDLGITVCGTESLGFSTAEHTWALILALVRQIPREDAATRAGHWQLGLGQDLHGKTLGILGLGRLGAMVARVALAFQMNVVAWSQNLTEQRAAECGVKRVDKETLLREADIITIHLRLSERTRSLIDNEAFTLMKPSAYLINTSRGPIVSEAALVEALQSKQIAGAALDVYNLEPLPSDHILRRLDNTVVSPHLGFVSVATYRLFYRQMLEDIQAWLAGKPIRVIS